MDHEELQFEPPGHAQFNQYLLKTRYLQQLVEFRQEDSAYGRFWKMASEEWSLGFSKEAVQNSKFEFRFVRPKIRNERLMDGGTR
jgi:hypothetical protein